MAHQIRVELIGHLRVVGFDAAHVVGLFGGQTLHQRSQGDLELGAGGGGSPQRDSLRVAWNYT